MKFCLQLALLTMLLFDWSEARGGGGHGGGGHGGGGHGHGTGGHGLSGHGFSGRSGGHCEIIRWKKFSIKLKLRKII